MSFSDELRTLADNIYPWLNSFALTDTQKDKPLVHPSNPRSLTPRQIWKIVNKLSEVEPDIFLRRFIHFQWSFISPNQKYIITDLRMPVEHEFIRSKNIPVIKIINEDRGELEPCDLEKYVRSLTKDDVDYWFVNKMNGTKEFDQFYKENFK